MISSLEVHHFKRDSSRRTALYQSRLMSKHHDTISRSVTFLVIFFFKIPLEVCMYVWWVGNAQLLTAERWSPTGETFYKILFILFLPSYSKRKGNWNRGSFWTQHEYRACNCRVTFSLNLSISHSSRRPFETAITNAEETTLFQSDYFSSKHCIQVN